MAVSFSAEYLYQGAKVLTRNPVNIDGEDAFECPEALFTLARGVYSLGVLIIAPIGMLYHAGAAGVYYARSLAERDVAPLNLLAEQHLEAAGYDAKAFGTMLTTACIITFIALIVALDRSFESAVYSLAGLIAILVRPISDMIERPYAESIFLTYNYMMTQTSFMHLLSEEQGRIYGANHIYGLLVKQGMAVDRPLDNDAIQGILQLGNLQNLPTPVPNILAPQRVLLRLDRAPQAHRARMEAFVDRGHELEASWNRIQGEANNRAEEERNDFINREFTAALQAFHATLPPIGAPALREAQE